jgi:hypothetical protein
MANEKHLLLTLQGDYVAGGLAGEIWQTSVRLGLNFLTGLDPVGILPDNWDPEANPINRTETNWTISSNWTIGGPGINTFDPGDYLNDQAAPAVETFMANAELSNQVRVRALTLLPVGSPNGKSVPAVPYQHGTPCTLEWIGSGPGGTHSGTQLPVQNSVVVSLRTLQVGSAGRGRMFLPSPSSTLLANGRVSNVAAQDIAEGAKDFMEALAFTGGNVNVRPIVTGGNFTRYAVVNRVRVGNVVDTQRRRRNRLQEVYYDQNVSY